MVHSCAISMVHGMLSGTAAADFGGPKAAATAAGLFDGMEYIGGSFVGVGMGWMLEKFGWSIWGPSNDRVFGHRCRIDVGLLERQTGGTALAEFTFKG